jgi:hypothetical protein
MIFTDDMIKDIIDVIVSSDVKDEVSNVKKYLKSHNIEVEKEDDE